MKLFLFPLVAAIVGTNSHSLAQDADPFGAPSKEMKVLSINEKLNKTLIPKIEFEETPFEFCIMFLSARSQELDPTSDPDSKGVNIVLRPVKEKAADFSRLTVSLKTGQISLGKAIDAVANEVGKIAWQENNAIVIGDKDQKNEPGEIAKDAQTKKMVAKLKAVRIPSAEFANTPLEVALSWIKNRLTELEKENKKSVTPSIGEIKIETVGKMLTHDPFFKKDVERRVDLNLKNCTGFDLLSHTAAHAGLGIKWGPNKITLIGD